MRCRDKEITAGCLESTTTGGKTDVKFVTIFDEKGMPTHTYFMDVDGNIIPNIGDYKKHLTNCRGVVGKKKPIVRRNSGQYTMNSSPLSVSIYFIDEGSINDLLNPFAAVMPAGTSWEVSADNDDSIGTFIVDGTDYIITELHH